MLMEKGEKVLELRRTFDFLTIVIRILKYSSQQLKAAGRGVGGEGLSFLKGLTTGSLTLLQ